MLHTIDANDFFGTKYVIIDESSFLLETSSEEAKCKKSDVICEFVKIRYDFQGLFRAN